MQLRLQLSKIVGSPAPRGFGHSHCTTSPQVGALVAQAQATNLLISVNGIINSNEFSNRKAEKTVDTRGIKKL